MEKHWVSKLDSLPPKILENWDDLYAQYKGEEITVHVRGRELSNALYRTSISGTRIPRIALPKTRHAGERLKFDLKENLPGYFPYTAGVFRSEEHTSELQSRGQ